MKSKRRHEPMLRKQNNKQHSTQQTNENITSDERTGQFVHLNTLDRSLKDHLHNTIAFKFQSIKI